MRPIQMKRFLLVVLVSATWVGCANAPKSLCQLAADHVQECLQQYCASNTGDAVCDLAGAPAASVDSCDESQAATVMTESCSSIIDQARNSLSGKADAPCPWYFSWCAGS